VRLSITITRNQFRASCSPYVVQTDKRSCECETNDGALYKTLEVTVATSDFIAAPRRISLASFHSMGSSGTPKEVWIESHVNVK